MNHPDEALLHGFVDDALDAPERASVADHLAECPSCRAVVSPILELRREARHVFGTPDVARAPAPADLWERIEARITASPPRAAGQDPGRLTGRPQRRWLGGRPAWVRARAAAAVVLLAGFSLSVAYYLGRPEGTGTPAAAPVGAVSAAGTGEGGAASITGAYEPVLAEMGRLLEEGRGRLRPETIAILEESLRVIDGAIGEIRDALASDPGHPGVRRSLEGAYQAKLRLLRQAIVLTPPEG